MTTRTHGKYRIYEMSGSYGGPDKMSVNAWDDKTFDDYFEAREYLVALLADRTDLDKADFVITQPIWDHLGNYDRYQKT